MDQTLATAASQRKTFPGLWERARYWAYLPHAILFVTVLAAFAYTPPRWQDWNQNSRFDLTRALVEQRSIRIDSYADNTGDYARIGDHIYSDKAPGLSLAAAPVYAITRALQPLGLEWATQRFGSSSGFASTLNPQGRGLSAARIDVAAALYLATLVGVAFPAALMLVLIALIVECLWGCRTAGIITALVLGLATPVFTYSQAFYGHVPAAASIVAAFALLVLRPSGALGRGRLLAVGLLLGWAVVVELPAAVVALPVALWALALAGRRAVLYGVLGALPPLAILAVYNLAAFGTPWTLGYERSTLWQPEHQQGFISLTYPRWSAIWGLSGSPFRGLFFFSPVLLLTIPGLWLALRSRRRSAAIVAMTGFAAMFIVISSSVMWWGGFAVGPRYLLPGVPFLAVPLGATVAWINSRPLRPRLAGLAIVAGLAALSVTLIWATTFAGQGYPPDTQRDPLTSYVLPAMREGDLARNLGMILHLPGILSIVPLLMIVALGTACLGLSLRHAQREAAT